MENTITTSLSEYEDPVVSWGWMQCRVREAAMAFGEKNSAGKREERSRLEKLYLSQLQTADSEATDTALRLQRFFHDEDAAIRFRSKVQEVESDEKLSLYFFARIKSNEKESNVENIITDKYPAGTTSKTETMDAIETHFKNAFTEAVHIIKLLRRFLLLPGNCLLGLS
jgi:hypothetical protein